ncbi:unnamed protein product [Brugia timori]|uniref:Uncharacterized protein n=1 Tax=Brugia timori TaxID=42155 RepID=A0A0R3Q411_9BILA|nr:unnamed protein product [Brugia timori]
MRPLNGRKTSKQHAQTQFTSGSIVTLSTVKLEQQHVNSKLIYKGNDVDTGKRRVLSGVSGPISQYGLLHGVDELRNGGVRAHLGGVRGKRYSSLRCEKQSMTATGVYLPKLKIQRVEKYKDKHNILAINETFKRNDSYDTQRQFKDQEEKGKKQQQSVRSVLLIVQRERREKKSDKNIN